MLRLPLMRGLVVVSLLTASVVLAQDGGSSKSCRKNGKGTVTGGGLPLASAGSADTWVPTQPVQKVQLEIGAVDVNEQILVLNNPIEHKSYPVKIDKSVKLSADKKVMRRKPEVGDFNKGDIVRATVNLMEGRVLEIKLVNNGNRQDLRN
jgi:hypothetical protein